MEYHSTKFMSITHAKSGTTSKRENISFVVTTQTKQTYPYVRYYRVDMKEYPFFHISRSVQRARNPPCSVFLDTRMGAILHPSSVTRWFLRDVCVIFTVCRKNGMISYILYSQYEMIIKLYCNNI